MKERNDSKRNRCLIIILLFITISAVLVCIWAVFFRTPDVILAPDYAPPETEEYAQSVPDDGHDKMQSEEGGGSVNITYSNQVDISLEDEKAYLMFMNPSRSNQNMVLHIVIHDEVVVQSGIIAPGYRINELSLQDGAAEMLSEGGYDGSFEVYYYNPDSNEKAVVNTVIPIYVQVHE